MREKIESCEQRLTGEKNLSPSRMMNESKMDGDVTIRFWADTLINWWLMSENKEDEM